MEFDSKLVEILKQEKRWTPKAFEKFGVQSNKMQLIIPLWENSINRIYDFSFDDKSKRMKSNKGSKLKLFGSIDHDEINLVEGEWDLFAAYEYGLENVATTTNGASAFNLNLAKQLQNKTVNIIYDRDGAGINGASRAAQLLKKVGCRVKIISLPEEVGDKGDLRDFFTKCEKTKEDLLQLTQEVDFYLTESESEGAFSSRNLKRVSDCESRSVDFLWKPYIPIGFVTMLTGDPGVGKSTITTQLASAISKGTTFVDGASAPLGNVVLFSVEDPINEVIRPKLSKDHADISKVFVYDACLTLDDTGFETIKHIIQECLPKLVIIDPIVAYVGGKTDTNKANEVREKMNYLTKLARDFHIAILVVRHMNKGNQDKLIYSGHGSIDFTAAVRSELMMISDPTEIKKRYLGHTKSNLSELGPTLEFSAGPEGLVFNSVNSKPLSSITKCFFESQKDSENVSNNTLINEMVLEILKDAPMKSTLLQEELENEGFRKGSINKVLSLKNEQFLKLRVNINGEKRGSGKWIVGRPEHIQALKRLKFDSLEQLDEYLRTFSVQEYQKLTPIEPREKT